MKICSKCKIEKSETEFRARKDRPCGLRSNCKKCDNVYHCTESGQQAARKYRQSEGGRMHASTRMAKHQRTPKGKATIRRYRMSPKGKLVKIRRREAEKTIDTILSAQDVARLYELFKAQCFNCGSTKRLCIDHHRPLSMGFGLTINNAVLLCGSCNSSKSNKNPEEFYPKEKLEVLSRLLVE